MDNGLWQSWIGTFTLPCFKEATPNLQGSTFFLLSLTASPVDYKAFGRKQNTSSSVPSRCVSSASLIPVLGQRHWWDDMHLKGTSVWVSRPLSRWKQHPVQHLFSVALRNVLSRGRSSAEPLLPNSLWFYLYVFPYFIPVRHCCLGVGASDQRLQVFLWTPGQVPPCRTKPVPWAAYDMHCWSNILPRVCHCSDINIFFS